MFFSENGVEVYHAVHDEHRRRLSIQKVNFRLYSACTMFEISSYLCFIKRTRINRIHTNKNIRA